MSNSIIYPGEELVLFEKAKNWKTYFSNQIKPFIKGKVLEVGAGLGATTKLLNDGSPEKWILLEPDERMKLILQKKIFENDLPPNCFFQNGILQDINEKFDTIIYIDVLEHIKADAEEINFASTLLNPKGNLVILAPAFNILYSPFDNQIGHHRRYTKKMLRAIKPEKLSQIKNHYYDTLGFFAALINRLILKQKYPTEKQVQLWDRLMIPLSKIMDKIFFHSFGKSIICIWQKSG
jgi:SAM-dependent methyltransferase